MRKIGSGLCFLIFFLAVIIHANAQKVKYKDLILLLSAKQYDKAEPFLKRYLKENDDNPNAFLYMGIVFQDKLSKIDPLLHTETLEGTIDSSLLYFDKSYKTITEKELRKNDEYYEAYMRRDLRTGKFVIKLSDVQLDIENRMNSLKTRKEKVRLLKTYFVESSQAYGRTNQLYKTLHSKYGAEREFFLRSDDEMLAVLKRISVNFDSAITAFEKYKSLSKELGKTGYNHVVDLQEIKDLKRDGSTTQDFMMEDLKLWDYKKWSAQATQVIEKEIAPLRDNLIEFDIALNKLAERLRTDSSSVKPGLAALASKLPEAQLKKYDPSPMPFDVFAMKMAELEYHSDLVSNKPLRDSLNVRLRLVGIKSEIADLKKLDSVSASLMKRDFSQEEKDYHHFISKAFGTTSVLQSLISSTNEYAKKERIKKETEWERISQSLKWLVAGTDSIPLYSETNRELKYKPLIIEEDRFTAGLFYKDTTAIGYFYDITPSRIPKIKTNFKVDQASFKKKNLSLFKGLATSDAGGNSFIVLIYSSEKANDRFPATLAKVYRTEGLAWSVDVSFELLPAEIKLSNENGEISVRTSAADGASKIVSFDKNGAVLK